MKWIILAIFAIIGLSAINRSAPGLPPILSGLHLDTGTIKYELSTPLFTDYAEKARGIKLPPGTTLAVTGDGLPILPEGAILAKTFFYWLDKRDTTKGKQLVETRILIKTKSGWVAGTYVWNKEQTDAALATSGQKAAVSWIDDAGERHDIHYRIPSAAECATCHQSNKELIPIGFKVRSLNIDVKRDHRTINQLNYFAAKGLISSVIPSAYSTLPAWNDPAQPLEKRVRAYLDVNCAHCHNDKGFCSQSDFRPAYENTLEQTKIEEKKKRILAFIRSGRMPLIGTTVVHKEGLELIEHYLNLHK